MIEANMDTAKKGYWVIIPAAGVGKRMGSDIPKQYLPLAGKTVLEQTLDIFIEHKDICGIALAVTYNDPYWQDMAERYPYEGSTPLIIAPGGKERYHSVFNALQGVARYAKDDDWVLVHDAARPCLLSSDIDRLISESKETSCGGLLGLPMTDTVKRCDSQHNVLATVKRSNLWRALTPQMFPLKMLHNALTKALKNNLKVTDEASAMELQGLKVKIIEGQPGNIKITHLGDLQLAELFFANRSNK